MPAQLKNVKWETKTPIILYTESTPNPSAMKFVSNVPIINSDKQVEYTSLESTDGSPLAMELFRFNFIDSVFISYNYITITKRNNVIWDDVVLIIKEFIKGFIESESPAILVFPEDKAKPETYEKPNASVSIIIKQIEDVLETYVKPAVEQDGGAIVFRNYDIETGKVTVALKGSCSGCPSSQVTLKSGVERLLKSMVKGVSEVEAEAV